MAATESNMLELGTVAPAFSLPDADGNLHSLAEDAAATLVMFICNHCPFVQHVLPGLTTLGIDYEKSELAVVAISSNDVNGYPDDSPEHMAQEAHTHAFAFPYLYDASQEVAKAYRAACTPDFYLFDKAHKLVYRGQLDDSRPGNGKPVDGADLRAGRSTRSHVGERSRVAPRHPHATSGCVSAQTLEGGEGSLCVDVDARPVRPGSGSSQLAPGLADVVAAVRGRRMGRRPVRGGLVQALDHARTALALHPARLDYRVEVASQLLCLGSEEKEPERAGHRGGEAGSEDQLWQDGANGSVGGGIEGEPERGGFVGTFGYRLESPRPTGGIE